MMLHRRFQHARTFAPWTLLLALSAAATLGAGCQSSIDEDGNSDDAAGSPGVSPLAGSSAVAGGSSGAGGTGQMFAGSGGTAG
ncbi:MAG TPA: hypothetical protein VIM73_12170, partial [Polyangiaceae bacterium]